jgi:Uma2 family endonuclease
MLQALRYEPDDNVHIGYEETDREVSADGLYVSEDEYWEKYYDHPYFNYEWNNGCLEEKAMPDPKSYLMYKWFLRIADHFLTVNPIAAIMGLEFGFRLTLPRKKRTIRKPDLAIVLNENPIILHPDDQSYKGIFDICIESLSYSRKKEIIRDTVDKKKEYRGAGVKEYYILDARGLETAFYRLDKKGKYQEISPVGEDVIESHALPGFRFRIPDLYEQPSFEQMADDDLYNSFFLPFHKRIKKIAEYEHQRAESERQRAESEHQRAESERQRAEAEKRKALQAEKKAEQVGLQLIAERQRAALLADKLKQLGISVE